MTGKTPQEFQFTLFPSVQNVQRLLSLLSNNAPVTPRKQTAGVLDALKEEANRENPKLDWICNEIVSNAKTKKYRLDPDWRNDRGESLLHLMCKQEGCGKAVKVLLKEAKFDPMATDGRGLTALHGEKTREIGFLCDCGVTFDLLMS